MTSTAENRTRSAYLTVSAAADLGVSTATAGRLRTITREPRLEDPRVARPVHHDKSAREAPCKRRRRGAAWHGAVRDARTPAPSLPKDAAYASSWSSQLSTTANPSSRIPGSSRSISNVRISSRGESDPPATRGVS